MLRDKGSEFDDRLPRIAELTPEALAEADAIQARRAAAHPLGDRKLDRANAMIKAIEAVFDPSDRQISDLATSYATVGRYDKAYEVTRDIKYMKIWNAIHTDSECKCDPIVEHSLVDGQVEKNERPDHTVQRVVSVRHNKDVDYRVCNKCGHANVK